MKKKYIEIESKKIPLADIKSYEIVTEEIQQHWIEKKKPNLLVRIILFLVGAAAEDRGIVKNGNRLYDVLIIRTIQGVEYRFSKNEYVYDMGKIVKELNQYMITKCFY